jgi:hypothetical protein
VYIVIVQLTIDQLQKYAAATFGIEVRFDAFGIGETATNSIDARRDARFDAFGTSVKRMLFVARRRWHF